MHLEAASSRNVQETLPEDVHVEWHAVEVGAGRPVVLLHDLGRSERSWGNVVDVLSGDWRCVAVDLPGHGESAPTSAGSTLSQVVGDLGGVLDEFGVLPAVVVGHGVGADVAAVLAAECPERVSGLVLVAPDPIRASGRSSGVSDMVAQLTSGDSEEFHDVVFPRLYADRFFLENPGRAISERAAFQTLCGSNLDEFARAVDESRSISELLDGIDVPVLVIAGALDEFVSPAALEALCKGAGAHFEVVADSGHSVPIEQPVELADAIGHFLERR